VLIDTHSKVAELAMLETARRHGVVYDPASSFRALPGDDDTLMLRLCFSNLSTALITRGLERLQRAWHAARQ
jgi:DNA-binding transcriptional MocR family regulator